MMLYHGGRDLAKLYIANLGDFYFLIPIVFLLAELISNHKREVLLK